MDTSIIMMLEAGIHVARSKYLRITEKLRSMSPFRFKLEIAVVKRKDIMW